MLSDTAPGHYEPLADPVAVLLATGKESERECPIEFELQGQMRQLLPFFAAIERNHDLLA